MRGKFIVLGVAWAAIWAAGCLPARADEVTELAYEIHYKDKPVGTQIIRIGRADGVTTVAAESKLAVKVLFKTFAFEDKLTATFRGTDLIEFSYNALDDGKPLEISATPSGDDLLIVKKEGRRTREMVVSRSDFDLHSWSPYLDPDLSFLEGREANRLLSLEDGEITEQRLLNMGRATVDVGGTTHSAIRVDWRRGKYTNQTWHLPEQGNVPVKYIYEDENGQTVFLLQ